jgi:hypothetical protein
VRVVVERYGNGFRFTDSKTGAELDGAAYLEAAGKKARAEHRRLVEAVFSGRFLGKPSGVYVYPEGTRKPYLPQAWAFTLRGLLPFESVVLSAAC